MREFVLFENKDTTTEMSMQKPNSIQDELLTSLLIAPPPPKKDEVEEEREEEDEDLEQTDTVQKTAEEQEAMRVLLESFDQDQLSRYEVYRRWIELTNE